MAEIKLKRLEAGGKFNVQPQCHPEAGAAGDYLKITSKLHIETGATEGGLASYPCLRSHLTSYIYKQIKTMLT